jgi:ligand-binding sensor domain-containing protein/two-component sensor histidine kinase
MKRSLIIFLFVSVFQLLTIAQPASISLRNLNINEGLSQSSVVDIAADNSGFLWFATQDGLNRFDGKQFLMFKKNFDDFTTAKGSTTGKIAVGNHNDLWIITSGGKLERMNLYDHEFTSVTTLDGKKMPPVSCILPDASDNIWIGSESDGLFIYNQKTRRLIQYTAEHTSRIKLGGNTIENIFKDKNGSIWVITNKGFTEFKNSTITVSYLPKDEQQKLLSLSTIAEDRKQNLWIGTYGQGLYIKKNNQSLKPFTGFNALHQFPANLTIFTIMADQFNRLWVGTYGQGLFVINQEDSTIVHLMSDKKNPFSLGYNDVLSIREDKKGGIWIGTDGGGVNYYDRRLNNFALYSASNVPEDVYIEQIRSITTDKHGGIWLGTSNNGLTYLNVAKDISETIHFSPYKQSIPNPERIASLLTDEDGDIWIGTQGNGLIILDPKTKRIKRQFHPDTTAGLKIPDHTIWCMNPDPNKNVWIGTRHGGLSLINKQHGIVKTYMHEPGNNNSAAENNVRKIIAINDSILCVGYEKKGIQFFNVSQGKFSRIPALDSLWQIEITLKTVYFNYPLLWIGTLGKGIITYNLITRQTVQITEEHGLPNHTIYAILPDKSGALWISSNKGICRINPPVDLKMINRSHFTLFSVEDGLQSNEFNTGAYYCSDEGLLFFGGIKGLNVFSPNKIIVSHQPINTAIIQVTINNKPFDGDTIITYKNALHLSHKSNSLAFNFAALDFVSANKLTYYYQLTDHDKSWVNAGNRNYASYTNLPPGKYIFKVKASNGLSTSNDPVTTLSIIIDPPFWSTWWFLLLSLLGASGILYALYRYRINQLIALQKVRNRIATDLHDDIGSTLTNISILSELSRKNMQNPEQTKNFLNRISEEVYFSNQALEDIVWSINTNNDTLEQTVTRMRRYAAEMFDGANISYALHLDEQFERYKLNMDQRRDCFLLFKEAINNIYKHAQAKNVFIKIWIERNTLHMEIRDDGKGFNTSVATNRNGLKNMHSRIKKWKGSLNIQSAEGEGTCTELRLPL